MSSSNPIHAEGSHGPSLAPHDLTTTYNRAMLLSHQYVDHYFGSGTSFRSYGICSTMKDVVVVEQHAPCTDEHTCLSNRLNRCRYRSSPWHNSSSVSIQIYPFLLGSSNPSMAPGNYQETFIIIQCSIPLGSKIGLH